MSGWDSLSWEGKRSVVLHESHYWCEMCSEAPAVEVDHIWPKSLGGSDQRYNLRSACRPCNAAKGQDVRLSDLVVDPELLVEGYRFDLDRAVDGAVHAVRWQVLRALLREGVDGGTADDLSNRSVAGVGPKVVAVVDVAVERALTATVEQAAS